MIQPPWEKGKSGNPGGRPKMMPVLRQRCRDMTPNILEKLASIIDGSPTDSARVSAAKLILAYGWGQPEAKVTVEDVTERPTQGLTREKLLAIASMPVPEEPDPDPDTQH